MSRRAPARIDAEAAEPARSATGGQLLRVLRTYAFGEPQENEPERPEPEEARRVGFGPDERGARRLSAVLPADEGAVVEPPACSCWNTRR